MNIHLPNPKSDAAIGRMDIPVSLVRRLLAEQFPVWSDRSLKPVEPGGWDNRTFRLGEDLTVRLPRAERYAAQVDKEQRWLPRLAPHLPVAIPVPVAVGRPGEGYPWRWSVYRWIEGESAAISPVEDATGFGAALARFLTALQRVDTTGGPPPGPHSFFRGGSLRVYDEETRRELASLRGRVDVGALTTVWETALSTTWRQRPVWVHGDFAATNLLVARRSLSAVIDFGSSGVGDPACDLTIAWTFLSGRGRAAFRAGLSLDEATWARARGWALWKALITLSEPPDDGARVAADARHVIDDVLADDRSGA